MLARMAAGQRKIGTDESEVAREGIVFPVAS